MRPLRLVLLVISCVLCPTIFTFFTLLSAHPRQHVSTSSAGAHRESGFRTWFSFHSPSSLFPPSAIISLTDDNSTFFLARPAAFGPLLPSKGLSGQLWVGSGFGDDSLRRGGLTMGTEGELGCSDVPGWADGDSNKADSSFTTGFPSKRKAMSHRGDQAVKSIHEVETSRSTTARNGDKLGALSKDAVIPSEEDGTDDYLHHPLPGSEALRSPMRMRRDSSTGKGRFAAHADIQSLQESAEITGKIALLSRGGCGFLEKVKWVQRRGGVALIVGDHTRGGGLVTMYARGDTSNVTIPSLFTSHTTAHLLSSLIPPKGSADDLFSPMSARIGHDENKIPIGSNRSKSGKKSKGNRDGADVASATHKVTPISISRPTIVPASTKAPSPGDPDSASRSEVDRTWLGSILAVFGLGDRGSESRLPDDSRRPPSSGHLNWVPIGDRVDDDIVDPRVETELRGATKNAKLGALQSPERHQSPGDDFVIGVQDWRDPDLLGVEDVIGSSSSSALQSKETLSASRHKTKSPAVVKSPEISNERLTKTSQTGEAVWEGGSITPGSGEYAKPGDEGADFAEALNPSTADTQTTADGKLPSDEGSRGWFQRLPWLGSDDDDDDRSIKPVHSQHGDHAPHGNDQASKGAPHVVEDLYGNDGDLEAGEGHEGLWVTLTPTSVSASPFFDTLLVLVVSPLVTLTIVYALLLLRSRIRRRRWRAPKSVVDRLPVRTYQTMTCSSTPTSPAPVSPNSLLPTSPLLLTGSRSTSPRPRPRPRSRTTSEVGTAVTASPDKSAMRASPPLQHEKLAGSPQWTRRYMGTQVECVVCLEEYVDGQSRVMSLPCGHEFHVECM